MLNDHVRGQDFDISMMTYKEEQWNETRRHESNKYPKANMSIGNNQEGWQGNIISHFSQEDKIKEKIQQISSKDFIQGWHPIGNWPKPKVN